MGEGDLIQDRKIRGKITIPGRVPVEFENARCHVGELRAAEPAKLGEWTLSCASRNLRLRVRLKAG